MTNKINDRSILLHACCGPCAEWPISALADEGFDMTLYFYNPNIHPRFEQERRLLNLKIVSENRGIPLIVDDAYLEDLWKHEEYRVTDQDRCTMCYRIRMDHVAEQARAMDIPCFTTTLLVSPYQKHEAIIEAAEEAAKKNGVTFLYRDFRPGFRQGQQMAIADGLYRQKYCGCILSLEESSFREKIYKDFAGSSAET